MEALEEFSRHVSSPCASVNTPQLGIHYQMFLPICTEFPPSCPLGRTDVCLSRGNTCDIQDHSSSAGRLWVCVIACFLFDQMPTLCTVAAWPVHQCNISVNATLKHCAYAYNNSAYNNSALPAVYTCLDSQLSGCSTSAYMYTHSNGIPLTPLSWTALILTTAV